jgi:hypothetical protein
MHGAWTLVSRNRNKKMAWDLPGPTRRFQPMLIRGFFRMPSTVASGGQDEVDVSIDALNLPPSLTKVKCSPYPRSEFSEEIISEIQRQPREKLRISRVTTAWGGIFAAVRFWNDDDGVFRPSRRGVNIRKDNIEAVIDALREVAAK